MLYSNWRWDDIWTTQEDMWVPFITVWTSWSYCHYMCDGTDDQVQINQAIEDLPNGWIIFIRRWTYYLSSNIIARSNITIMWEWTWTKLYLVNSSNSRMIKELTGWIVNFRLYWLWLDWNWDNQTWTSDLIHLEDSSDIIIDSCLIEKWKRHNVMISEGCDNVKVINCRLKDPKTLSNFSSFNSDRLTFMNNTSTWAIETGCKMDGWQSHKVVGNVCHSNTTHQIYLTKWTGATWWTTAVIADNTVQWWTSWIRLVSFDYATIWNNTCRWHTQNWIELHQNVNYVTINWNVVRDIGSDAANTYSGISITDSTTACTNNIITSNIIVDTASNMKYWIYAGNNSDYTFHWINQIAWFVTAAYSLVWSNNKLVSLV